MSDIPVLHTGPLFQAHLQAAQIFPPCVVLGQMFCTTPHTFQNDLMPWKKD